MSGGVDSSVSAYLLKKEGYDVTGFFMKFWSDESCQGKRENSCCNDESLKSARKIASKLGIPFHVVDAKKLFKTIVVDDFISEYKDLKTPNPCIKCNKFIKFGWFLELTKSTGFDEVATGHYCRIRKDKKGTYHLSAGRDVLKDQSYFLFRLDQEQLSKVIFPVGNLNKKEVYKIAKEVGLKFEDKKESQEICFIQDEDYRDFLKRHLSIQHFKSGNIVNMEGKLVGQHQGLVNYTIGQRKGIEPIGVKDENKKPSYVIGFNKKKNELIIGTDKDVYKNKMVLMESSWIFPEAKKIALKSSKLKIKIRYKHEPALCRLAADKSKRSKFIVTFDKPQRAITPGQYAVFYLGKEVLGGGVISS